MKFGKQKSHAGININDTSIELILVDNSEHPHRITASGRIELSIGSIVRGSILDEQRVRNALQEIKQQIGLFKEEKINVTLSVSEYLVFPFAISVSEIPQSQRIKYIKEQAEKRVPMHVDEQAHFIIQESLTKDYIVVYAINRHIIQYYQEILQKEHFEVDHIEPEGVAAARFMLPNTHTQERTYVADIGKETTTIITLSYGMPIVSQTIPIGTTLLAPGKKIDKKVAAQLQSDIITRLTNNSGEKILVLIIGGGSLLNHIIDLLNNDHLTIQPGIIGQPIEHAKLKDAELRLYAHALGSALRLSSTVGGSKLVNLDSIPIEKKRHVSLSQFKNRTAMLIAIFVTLIVALLFIIFLPKNEEPVPPPASVLQDNAFSGTNKALNVFTLELESGELPFTQIPHTLTEETTVETTGQNDDGNKIVAKIDVTTAEQRMKGVLTQQLDDYFKSITTTDQKYIFASVATKFSVLNSPNIDEEGEAVTISVTATGYALELTEKDINDIVQYRIGENAFISSTSINLPLYEAETQTGTLYIRTTYER